MSREYVKDDLERELEEEDIYVIPSVKFSDDSIKKFKAICKPYSDSGKLLIGEIIRIRYQKIKCKEGFFKIDRRIIPIELDVFKETGLLKKDAYIYMNSEEIRRLYVLPNSIEKSRYQILNDDE